MTTALFWTALDETVLPYSAYHEALELAHVTCDTLDAGASLRSIVAQAVLTTWSDPLASERIGNILGAGIGGFCPRHEWQIDSL